MPALSEPSSAQCSYCWFGDLLIVVEQPDDNAAVRALLQWQIFSAGQKRFMPFMHRICSKAQSGVSSWHALRIHQCLAAEWRAIARGSCHGVLRSCFPLCRCASDDYCDPDEELSRSSSDIIVDDRINWMRSHSLMICRSRAALLRLLGLPPCSSRIDLDQG